MTRIPAKSDIEVLTPNEARTANVIPARIANLRGLWRVYCARSEFRVQFSNGWEQRASTIHEMHSAEFFSACRLVHDLHPREADWER
jgi:hypothetical protein